MERYQVTDPNGVLVGPKLIPKGEPLPLGGHTGSQVRAWLRFGQISKVEEAAKPETSDPPDKDATKPKK